MVNEEQMKILKIMNLSESKANIDIVDRQFGNVRHLLDDIVGLLTSAGEIEQETLDEYKTIETEIFHVTKFVEKMGFEIRSKRRAVESRMFEAAGDKQ